MEPGTMALIGLGLEGISRGAKGYQTYSAQKDLFDEDAAKRLKELERMEAINMLGGDIQTYQSQQMTPVQGAMREARERMAQDISSQDLSGGAYFRGQQAMTEAAGKERSAAQQRSQEQYRREEEINRVELDSLRKRKQMADNAARDAFLASMEGVDKSGQAYMMMELEREKLDALRTAAKGANEQETNEARVGFDIGIDPIGEIVEAPGPRLGELPSYMRATTREKQLMDLSDEDFINQMKNKYPEKTLWEKLFGRSQ